MEEWAKKIYLELQYRAKNAALEEDTGILQWCDDHNVNYKQLIRRKTGDIISVRSLFKWCKALNIKPSEFFSSIGL